ncbi:MAG TPA: hypothetical protein VF600_14420 [Abditibacteriaceae bacterium]|jgi:DNA-binding beta-propeller fold protein YncE
MKVNRFCMRVVAVAVGALWLLCVPASAQDLPHETSWIGNSFGGADNKWVQNYVDEIEVSPDGTLYAASEWDEAGRCTGIYKDGDVHSELLKQYDGQGGHKAWGWGTAGQSVAIDGTYIYLVNTEGDLLRFRRDKHKYVDQIAVGKAVGMAASDTTLCIVRDNGDIQVRSTSNLSLVQSFNVASARDVVFDRQGSLWILAGTQILHYDAEGNLQSGKIVDAGKPTALSIDNRGRLIVCDNGPRSQVLFYDLAAVPRMTGCFGVQGGMAAGTPGEVKAQKLFHLAGAATDAAGNLFVALSGGAWDGTILRKFAPDGKLVWELNGLHFRDSAVVDPASDGAHVYGGEEHYVMDYTRPPGKQATLRGYTYDPSTQDDARRKECSYHAAFARRVDGRLLLFETDMYTNAVEVYYFSPDNGEFAQRAYSYKRLLGGWGVWADKGGNLWECSGKQIRMTPLIGFDASGKPQYGAAQSFDGPALFDSLQRIQYFPESDTMYLAGYSPQKKEETWGIVGKVLARYDNWSKGNRQATWVLDVPHDFKPKSGPKVTMKAMAVEGDYVFLVGVETRSQVQVFRADDGSFVGYLNPGAAFGSVEVTGWVDMPNALSAFRRSNGEYLIFVEENYRNKVILYRWRPSPVGDAAGPLSAAVPQ